MTTHRWLQLASAATAAALLFMIVIVWRSAVAEHARANDIGARVDEMMNRIEAEAGRLENAAR